MRGVLTQRQRRDIQQNKPKYVLFALVSLVIFWMISFLILATKWHHTPQDSLNEKETLRGNHPQVAKDAKIDGNEREERALEPQNLSRSDKVTVMADVRGNLGPASVVIQRHPGKDWIHDRWQAASDMHGKNIPGTHWIMLDFGTEVVVDRIVLDWEAAYSDQYRLEGSLEPISTESPAAEKVWTLFDGTDPSQKSSRSVEEVGQSPGVKMKTPLHVVHKLYPLQTRKPLRYLRLYILTSAMGWGVSLWQFDVFGFHKDEVVM